MKLHGLALVFLTITLAACGAKLTSSPTSPAQLDDPRIATGDAGAPPPPPPDDPDSRPSPTLPLPPPAGVVSCR